MRGVRLTPMQCSHSACMLQAICRINNLRNCEMTVNVLKGSLPRLPDKPHHPQKFLFFKRMFGKTKPVMCSAQSQWFTTWPFLHYDEAQDVAFCHTCVMAFKLDRIKSSNNVANAFASVKLRITAINMPIPSTAFLGM